MNTQEQYKTVKQGRINFVQYDYRHTDGDLFSTIAINLTEARARRQQWIVKKLLGKIHSAGIPGRLVFASDPDIEDDSIVINDEVSVQVCEDGLFSLTVCKGEVFHCGEYTHDIDIIFSQITKELKK